MGCLESHSLYLNSCFLKSKGDIAALIFFWLLTFLGEPSIQTAEGRRREEAVKFATCFGQPVQSVTLQQCGGLILFSSEC